MREAATRVARTHPNAPASLLGVLRGISRAAVKGEGMSDYLTRKADNLPRFRESNSLNSGPIALRCFPVPMEWLQLP